LALVGGHFQSPAKALTCPQDGVTPPGPDGPVIPVLEMESQGSYKATEQLLKPNNPVANRACRGSLP
ncbi:hypothetical protein KUCAC02_007030, partial [Chaenocephalus aceratus]